MRKLIIITAFVLVSVFFGFGLFLYKLGEDNTRFRCGVHARDY